MKRKPVSFTALLALIIAAPVLVAQQEDPQRGGTGLVFQIAGLGQFGLTGAQAGTTTLTPLGLEEIDDFIADLGLNIPVYGIGVKGFITDDLALRGTFGVNYTGKTTTTVIPDTSGADRKIEQTDDLFIAAFSPGFEYHFARSGPVNGYVGAMFSYAGGFKTIGPDSSQQSNITSALMVGPVLGAEFFPWDNVSLGAEYILGFQSTSITQKTGDVERDGPSFTNIGTSSFAVRATLYFD